MNESEFIDLALRYLDGAASQAEVDTLGRAMLDRAALRSLYRDLVRQAQLAHEWEIRRAPLSQPHHQSGRPSGRPLTNTLGLAAAAAAVVIGSVILLRSLSPPVPQAVDPEGNTPPEHAFFDNRNPSWSEIYRSPFDYPDFVWQAEIPAQIDESSLPDPFSETGFLPLIARVPTTEFKRLLAPIALLPGAAPSDGLLVSP